MAKKSSERPTKVWTPDDPLKVDFSKVLQKKGPAESMAERLAQTDTPFFSQGGNAKHPNNPANHNPRIRQKKG